jgi:ferric-dicitrate binding protein FerR (iron transport regulator)
MDYSVQQLIHNQSFRRMVKGEADADEVSKWNHWIEADDEHRQKAKEAIAEIAGFAFNSPEQPDINKEWKRLRKVTIQKKWADLPMSSRIDGHKWLYRVAAILLVAGLMGAGIFMYAEKHHLLPQVKQMARVETVSTKPGEQQTIFFSDNSKIILNSHSTVSYQLGASHNHNKDVTLQGEAYFTSPEGAQEFTVHTPDGIIRDVGRSF